MCGFGDKVGRASNKDYAEIRPLTIGRCVGADRLLLQDRRPITPPPCIRLIVKDSVTNKELDIK